MYIEAPHSIELQSVAKRYRKFTLQIADLAIDSGSFVSIIGPSGAGKTTLLSLVGGFIKADAGTIKISGQPVNSQTGTNRVVRTVFQDLALFPHMTVIEQLRLAQKFSASTTAETSAKECLEWLERLDLLDRQDSLPHELSGGERQRLALGRALIARPQVLLLDEPMTAVDQHLRQELWKKIDALLSTQQGLTVLMITHDSELALAKSDLLLVLDEGKCIQLGTPEDLYSHPKSEIVARLLGPINVITLDGKRHGIRPELIAISSGEIGNKDFVRAATVQRVNRYGGITEACILWNDLEISVKHSDLDLDVQSGAYVKFGWNTSDVVTLN